MPDDHGLEKLSREELIARVRRQDARLAEQADQMAEQERQLERLQAELERLKRLISRNSSNSSMPPSADDALPGRGTSGKRRRTGRGGGSPRHGRGKQPGAQGRWLPWTDAPDERVCHRPAGRCGCGADLAAAADVGLERAHQVHDLPEVDVTVTQHEVWRVRCTCGTEHVGQSPPEVAAPASYGVNLKALVIYLIIYQHVPVQRAVALIADLTGGMAPSTGFAHGMLGRCAGVLSEVTRLIKTAVTAAAVAGFDETTIRSGPAGRKRYVLSGSTEHAVAYHLGGRDLGSFAAFGILPAFTGIAVHDRYVCYYHAGWEHIAAHQVCCAHLARDFEDARQYYPDAIWPAQARRALSGLIRAWHDARDAGQGEIPTAVRDPLINEFRHAVRVGLAAVSRIDGPKATTAQPRGRELLEFCRDRQDDVLRFSGDTRVWPTNNISERDLRPAKTQQKISGRLTSEHTTQDRLDIRSYIDTARKNGVGVMTALRAALFGTPWHPPLPAPS